MGSDTEAPTLIRSRERMAQVRDFRGLRFGRITPTDIDGVIDFGGRLWVIFEMKFGAANMPRGQELALERLCDALERSGARAVVLVTSHESTGDIDCASAVVCRIREHGAWRNPIRRVTLVDAVEAYRRSIAEAA